MLSGLDRWLRKAHFEVVTAARDLRNRRAARLRTAYDPQEAREFFSRILRPGDLCFDIGANVGDRTELFASLGARVVAVEPQPRCAEGLRERFASSDVVVVESALGRSPGTAPILLNEENPGLATMSRRWRDVRFPDERWGQEVTVPVTTLDRLIGEHGEPVFCKIDVEGFEQEVLLGLSSPIRMLSFEFTGVFLDDLVANLATLQRLGPIEVNCAYYERARFVLNGWTSPERLVELLAARFAKDEVLSGDVYVRWR